MVSIVGFNLSATQLVCLLVALGNVASSAADSSSLVVQFKPLPEGYVSYPDIGMAYKVYDAPVVYTVDARNLCALDGARMAVIDSFTKFEYLLSLMPSSAEWMHAGIIRVDNKWININTGMIVSTVPWGPGEPSRNADRVYLHRSSHGLGDWHNINRHHYACELSISTNNLVISTSTGA